MNSRGVACTKVSACIGVGLSDRNGARPKQRLRNPVRDPRIPVRLGATAVVAA